MSRLGLAVVLAVVIVGTARAESVAQLEERSKSFYELLERGQRERAAALFPELERALAAAADDLSTRLDRMRDEVVEQDGDLEALYKSSRWREPEIASLVLTYHLAWVRYQGAQLTTDPARRKALLRQAADGFSQFLVVNEVPEIYAESLYGRGLAFLDLGDTAKAIEDLEAAAAEQRTATKARAALEEARRRASGRKAEETDPETYVARLREVLPRAANGDAAAEKDATTLARGLVARGGPWPARVQSVIADTLGDGQPASIRSSFGLLLLAQLAVDRSRCADVAPLVDASAKLTDAGRIRHRPELLFLQAGCDLNAGHPATAAEEFDALVREFPNAPRAREAAYYRFRALDVARADDATMIPAYEQALSTYLERYPSGEQSDAARFLLAELWRGRGDCAHAAPMYGRIASGPFAVRARLGALECRAAGLGADPHQRGPMVEDLRAFVRETPARGDDQPLVARAALLAALIAAGGRPPDHATVLSMLDGYEQRYPDVRDLHGRALVLRLRAHVGAGQLEAASRDLDLYLARDGDAERRRTLSQLGHELAARGDDAPSLVLARRVYRALLDDGGGPDDRLALADVELRAGNPQAARALYEAVLAAEPGSAEALRGAARAAAAAGDRDAAFAYWKRVVEGSQTGGTAWYEARLAQITLLAEAGQRSEACEVLRLSRGRATTTGADQLDARLRGMEPEVCR